MATIAEQLTELQAVKSGLKTALTADGADMSAVPFTDYPGKVQAMSERWYDFLNKTCTEIDLSGLSTIRSYMCFEYKNLETIKNMDKMKANTIGLSAFMGCTALKNVVILKPTTPPTITTSTFGKYVTRIVVPIGTGDTYKAASVWSNYASIIEEGTA